MNEYVKILKKAKKSIESRETFYICHAIGMSCFYDRNRAISDAIRKHIEMLLSPDSTLEGWMRRNHPEQFNQMSRLDFRQTRLRWIDDLIEYYKEK